MKKGRITLVIFLFIGKLLTAQSLDMTPDPLVYVEWLFHQKQYNSVINEVSRLRQADMRQEAGHLLDYFEIYARLELFHPSGEKKARYFIDRNAPEPYYSRIAYRLADHYQVEKKYSESAYYYGRVKTRHLTADDRDSFYFKAGYAYMSGNKIDSAITLFKIAATRNNDYKIPSNYYAGYLLYQQDQYPAAEKYLRTAESDDEYRAVVPYLRMAIMSRQSRHDELLTYGDEVLNAEFSVRNQDEIFLLMGDTYYEKGNYSEALEFLQHYVEKQKNPDRNILFKLGYAQYSVESYNQAEDQFKIVALGKDTIADYASYYLADIYLRENDSRFALRALEAVIDSKLLSDIHEPALFNLAKVNYELDRYDETITHLTSLLDQYPRTKFGDEANDLLGEAYLRTKNYARALSYLESFDQLSYRLQGVYQQVAYYLGESRFNNSDFPAAVASLKRSLQYPQDRNFAIMANFWLGETYAVGNYLDEARTYYNQVVNLSQPEEVYYFRAQYGLGYADYNQKDYTRARQHFTRYIDLYERYGHTPFYQDAYSRLADCYFVQKAYDQARSRYQLIIDRRLSDMDYALYQMGMIDYLQGKYDQAIAQFSNLIRNFRNSSYQTDAQYHYALSYFESKRFEVAINEFSKLLSAGEKNKYTPYALQKRAIAYSNLGRNQASADDYQNILDNYITSAVAESALLGLQEARTKIGDNTPMDNYFEAYRAANPDNQNLAEIEIESAKTLFNAGSYEQAIRRFKQYLKANPNHPETTDVLFYIAESYYFDDNTDSARVYYYQVLNTGFLQQNRVLSRLIEVETEKENYTALRDRALSLFSTAVSRREKENALRGLMISYYRLGEYDSAITYANGILEQGETLSPGTKTLTYLFKGKAFFEQNRYDSAIHSFTNCQSIAVDQNSAEAAYLTARSFYQRGDFDKALNELFNFNSKYSVYDYWLGKVFLLIADIYLATDEDFQAEATLNSIIENATHPEILEEARYKISQINDREADIDENEADTLNTGGENE